MTAPPQSAGRQADMHQRYVYFRALRRYASLLCRYRRFAPAGAAVRPQRARTASQVARDIETGTMLELQDKAGRQDRDRVASANGHDRMASAATTVVDFHSAEDDVAAAVPPGVDEFAVDLARQV